MDLRERKWMLEGRSKRRLAATFATRLNLGMAIAAQSPKGERCGTKLVPDAFGFGVWVQPMEGLLRGTCPTPWAHSHYHACISFPTRPDVNVGASQPTYPRWSATKGARLAVHRRHLNAMKAGFLDFREREKLSGQENYEQNEVENRDR